MDREAGEVRSVLLVRGALKLDAPLVCFQMGTGVPGG